MTVAKILIHVFIWVWCFSLYRCNVVCHSKKRLCCSDQKFVLLVAWMINSCVHTYPENDTSLCVGVHTHHVLSQIAESPSLPAEEQTHSEQSEETAPSHETTGDTCSSPTEPSLSEEQPPVCTYITTLASLPGFLLSYKQDFDKFMKLLSTLPII